MWYRQIYLILGFWLSAFAVGSAQIDTIAIQLSNAADAPVLEDTIVVQERSSVLPYFEGLVTGLIAKDHLEASLDSLLVNEKGAYVTALVHIGPQYSVEALELDSLSESLLDKLKVNKPKSARDFLSMRGAIKDYYGNNGYPFARVKLDDISLTSGRIKGGLSIDLGQQVIMDSLVIKGDLKLRRSYLRNYLQIFKGEVYDHSKMRTVRRKLDQLNFVTVVKDPELSFITNYATLDLYVDTKNASRFDLIFGVIPTNAISNRQLFLSLDFTAELLNKLGYGEYFLFDFERLRPEQQKLDLRFNYPYLLDTPFAIDTRFSIFRNALNYQTVLADMGLQYFINNSDKIKVSYYAETSRVVELDTLTILSGNIPVDLSIRQVGLAVELDMSRLDYKFNPRQGFALNFQTIVGRRQVLQDASLTEFIDRSDAFATAFNSLEKRTPRYEFKFLGSYFLPLAQRGALGLIVNAGHKQSSAQLLRNELFQIGGNKLLRGFDDASVFTSTYTIASLEYRLALGKNSYFQLPFVDVGFVDIDDEWTFVSGIGGGMVLETKVGLFNFSVAVGKLPEETFDFSRPKAHFGYISLF